MLELHLEPTCCRGESHASPSKYVHVGLFKSDAHHTGQRLGGWVTSPVQGKVTSPPRLQLGILATPARPPQSLLCIETAGLTAWSPPAFSFR